MGSEMCIRDSIYWGDNDGVTTPGNWDNYEDLGALGEGTFYTDITGLDDGVQYYYRCYAENSAGEDWADATETFTTNAIITVDWNNGNVQSITLQGDAQFTFTNGQPGGIYKLFLIQGTSGNHTVIWPPNVKWQGDSPPTLSTDSNDVDIAEFIYDGTFYFGTIDTGYTGD